MCFLCPKSEPSPRKMLEIGDRMMCCNLDYFYTFLFFFPTTSRVHSEIILLAIKYQFIVN